LILAVLTAGPGAVNDVGAAEYLATASRTVCETALDGDAAGEEAAGDEAAALLDVLLELPLEHAARARAPAAMRTTGASRRVENI